MNRSAFRSSLLRLLPVMVFLAGMALTSATWRLADLHELPERFLLSFFLAFLTHRLLAARAPSRGPQGVTREEWTPSARAWAPAPLLATNHESRITNHESR